MIGCERKTPGCRSDNERRRPYGRGVSTKPSLDPAQSKTPRTSGNIMHENRETWSASAARYGGRPVGKGQGRTAHRQAGQESDLGVVPMKGSNKGGQPTAESLEGRPETKENGQQLNTQPTQGGERVTQRLLGVRRVRRHLSKVRAVCGKSARTDPCGGCRATGIPTATRKRAAGRFVNCDRSKRHEGIFGRRAKMEVGRKIGQIYT